MQRWLIAQGDLESHGSNSNYRAAVDFAIVGECDRSLDFLEKAYQHHDQGLLNIGVLKEFDPLRSHPRFIAIVHRMHLDGNP